MNSSVRLSDSHLTGASIVHFAHGAWHEIWRTNQHIFSRLARENTVLYVEPKVYSLSAVRRGWVKQGVLRTPRLQHEADGLWLYRHPVWAPRTSRLGLEQLTRKLRWWALRRAMVRLGMHDPIITWVFQPRDAELMGTLGERLVIFQVIDEYAAYRHQSLEKQRLIREGEQRYLPHADLVIVTSQALLEAKRHLNPHTVLVPNGVDFAVFEKARQANVPPPQDIARLPRPIVGYMGHISLRLNLPLLAEIARRRPDWSLPLVGSVWEEGCKEELDTLRALPNVHFLGQKTREQVPHYLYAFDVCLIPYRQGEEARNISSIKLYEYLATGKPIVSIDIPSLDGFRHVVRVADSVGTFVREVETALRENDPGLVEERICLAAANTWEQRVEQISSLVQTRLESVRREC